MRVCRSSSKQPYIFRRKRYSIDLLQKNWQFKFFSQSLFDYDLRIRYKCDVVVNLEHVHVIHKIMFYGVQAASAQETAHEATLLQQKHEALLAQHDILQVCFWLCIVEALFMNIAESRFQSDKLCHLSFNSVPTSL